MDDLCYACDGTGERDCLSGARCLECGGTGWAQETEDPAETMSLQELFVYEKQADELTAALAKEMA